jgi:hypothetical protein
MFIKKFKVHQWLKKFIVNSTPFANSQLILLLKMQVIFMLFIASFWQFVWFWLVSFIWSDWWLIFFYKNSSGVGVCLNGVSHHWVLWFSLAFANYMSSAFWFGYVFQNVLAIAGIEPDTSYMMSSSVTALHPNVLLSDISVMSVWYITETRVFDFLQKSENRT